MCRREEDHEDCNKETDPQCAAEKRSNVNEKVDFEKTDS